VSGRPVAEPKLILLALGAVGILVLCIVAIADTDAVWLVLVTAVTIALIGWAIVLDLRRVIADDDPPAEVKTPPGRAVVVTTAQMTATEVLEALGPEAEDTRSIMIVAPEGLGGGGLMVDERAYQRALHAETSTVASLRRAGVNAAGHVGDRDPAHAIEDALALFPAGTVVVVARGHEADAYREHVDFDALRRRIGADVYVREFVDR
jgi:hypothetical protein